MPIVFPCLAALRVRCTLSSCLAAGLLAFGLAPSSRAQNNDLFLDADATLDTPLYGTDVIIGSVNVNPFTVTIANGAVIYSDGDYSDGLNGVGAYHQSAVHVTGGYVSALTLFDNSSASLSGGSVSSLYTRDSSVADVTGTVYNGNIGGNSVVSLSAGGTIYGIRTSGNGILNIQGGYLGYTDLHDNSVVNLTGGTGSSLNAYDNAVINVTGGQSNSLSTNYGGAISVSGGNVSYGITSYYGGPISISGGSVGDIRTYNDSSLGSSLVSVSGGSVASVSAYNGNGAINISGGSVGAVTVFYGATAQITGGSLTGPLLAQGYGAQITLIGSGLNIASSSTFGYWDGFNNYINAVYDVNGTLANGDALNATVNAGVGAAGDASTLTFQGTNSQLAPDLFPLTDATVTGTYNHVTVGQDASGTVNASPTVAFVTGTDAGNLNVRNASQVTVQDGVIHGFLNAYDTSNVTVNGGFIGRVLAYNDSIVSYNGGTVQDGAYTQDNATLNVGGGYLYNAYANGGTINLTGGTIANAGVSNGVINVSGGNVAQNVYVSSGGIINVTGGDIARLDNYGGVANLNGGTFSGPVNAFYEGVLNIGGGSYLGPISVLDNATAHVFGSGLSTVGSTLYGYWDGFHNYANGAFTLTGTLANGDPANATINAAAHYDGDASALTFYALNSQKALDLYLTSDTFVSTLADHVVIGRDATGTVNASPFVVFDAGTDTGNVDIHNDSFLFLQGGIVRGSLDLYDTSAALVTNATVSGNVTAHDATRFFVEDGANIGQATAQDNSVISVYGGYVYYALATNGGTLNIYNGTLNSLGLYNAVGNISGGNVSNAYINNGVVNASGGSIYSLFTDNSVINVSDTAQINSLYLSYFYGSGPSVANITGGDVNYVTGSGNVTFTGGTIYSNQLYAGSFKMEGGTLYSAYTSAEFDLSGGEVVGSVSLIFGGVANITGGAIDGTLYVGGYGPGVANISGGSVRTIIDSYGSKVFITGGQVGGIDPYLYDYEPIGIYLTGGDLYLTAACLQFLDPMYGYFGYYDGTYYTLQGRLQDGRYLNTTLFVANGSNIIIAAVPEPGAVAFGLIAGVGLLGLFLHRRRAANS